MEQIELHSHINGYHVYKDIWNPVIGENLRGEMEPTNIEDPYAVCVKKENLVVGHLERGYDGKLSQTIYFFLRADQSASCRITVTGHPVNMGDNLGMKVPCTIEVRGRREYIRVLGTTLSNYIV